MRKIVTGLLLSVHFCLLSQDRDIAKDVKSYADESQKITREALSLQRATLEAWKDDVTAPKLGQTEHLEDGSVWIIVRIQKFSDGSYKVGRLELATIEHIKRLDYRSEDLEKRVTRLEENQRRQEELNGRLLRRQESFERERPMQQPVFYQQQETPVRQEVVYVQAPQYVQQQTYSAPAVHYQVAYCPPEPPYCPPVSYCPPVAYGSYCGPRYSYGGYRGHGYGHGGGFSVHGGFHFSAGFRGGWGHGHRR